MSAPASAARRGAVAFLALLAALPAGRLDAGAFLTAAEGDEASITHPAGYDGSGGVIALGVCIDSDHAIAGGETAVENAIDTWNALAATTGNLRSGRYSGLATGHDFESTVLHELGHCLGLAHPNLGSESGLGLVANDFTRTTDGVDDVYQVGSGLGAIPPDDIGLDGFPGSLDDSRGDDANLHWFEKGSNDPFATVAAAIDGDSFGLALADLPPGHSFVQNGHRQVADRHGHFLTEAVMQDVTTQREVQRTLVADDVATARLARSGLDLVAGTADDYTVTLSYAGAFADPAAEPGCDVVLDVDNVLVTTPTLAVCAVTATEIVPGSGHFAIESPARIHFRTTGLDWRYNPRRTTDDHEPIGFDDTYALRSVDGMLAVPAATGVLADDVDPEGDPLTAVQVTVNPRFVLAADGSFTYTPPAPGFVGYEDFLYRARAGGLDAVEAARVRITTYPDRVRAVLPPLSERLPRFAGLRAQSRPLFGEAVEVDGDLAVVGAHFAHGEVGEAGEVHVFERDHPTPGAWGLRKTLRSPDQPVDVYSAQFGFDVELEGETLAVGEPRRNRIHVYGRDVGGADAWGLVTTIVNPIPGAIQLGFRMSLDGDRLLAMTFGERRALVFERHAGGPDAWGLVASLANPEPLGTGNFPYAVALSGDTAVVGATSSSVACPPGEPGCGIGAVHVYEKDHGGPGAWGRVTSLVGTLGDGVQAGELFGAEIALAGDVLAVGARNDSERAEVVRPALCAIPDPDVGDCWSGAVYVFERDAGGAWSEQAKLLGRSTSTGAFGEEFGHGLAVAGDVVLVGARDDEDPPEQSRGPRSGGIYVFQRDEGGPGAWGEVTRFTGSAVEADDLFGASLEGGVGFDGKHVVGGAFTAQNDEVGLAFMGEAYLFELLPPATPSAALRVQIDDARDPAVQGKLLAYTVRVWNDGPSDVADAAVAVTLPPDVAFDSAPGCPAGALASPVHTCTIGALAAGTSVAYEVVVAVSDPPAAAIVFSLTAAVSSSVADPIASDDTDDEETRADDSTGADLATAKTAFPALAVNGSTVTYTVRVENGGNEIATAVQLVDPLPPEVAFQSAPGCAEAGGIVTCALGDLDPGEAATVEIAVTVDPGTFPGTTAFANTATASTTAVDPDLSDNSGTATVTLVDPAGTSDLAIAKSAVTHHLDPSRVVAGSHFQYVLEVTNGGPATAADVVVTDTLPPEATFLGATLSPDVGSCMHAAGVVTCALGAITTAPADSPRRVTITVDLDPGTTDDATITNTATVASATANPAAGNAASLILTVDRVVDLELEKTAAQDPVDAGETFDYLLTVGKVFPEDYAGGPSDAADVVVTDVLPAGVSFVSASPAVCAGDGMDPETVTCELGTLERDVLQILVLTVRVDPSTPAGPIVNTASVATSTDDPDPSNDDDSATVTVISRPDLAVTVSSRPGRAVAGSRLALRVAVENVGAADHGGAITLVDTLPAGVDFVAATGSGWVCGEALGVVTCTRAAGLAAGALAEIAIAVDVPAATVGTLDNEAEVSSDAGADPFAANDVHHLEIEVRSLADLRLEIDGPGTVAPGGSLVVTMTVANAGPAPATALVLHAPTPVGLVFQSAGAPCAGGFPCVLPGPLAAGAALGFTVTYDIPAGYAGPDPIVGQASVLQAGEDSTPDDTVATTATAVGRAGSADLAVTLAGPATAAVGSAVVYDVVVSHLAGDDATGVSLAFAPAGLAFVAAEAPCAGGFPCALGNLAQGEVVRLEATFEVPPGYAGPSPIAATASLSAATADPDAANDTAGFDVAVGASRVDLAVEVSGPPRVELGEVATIDLVVTNAGPAAATMVSLAMATPAGLIFDGADAPCTGGVAPCDLGPLAAGDAVVLQVRYLVPAGFADGSFRVEAGVQSPVEAEADPSDDAAGTWIGVGVEAADLRVVKTGPGVAFPGEALGYLLAVTNLGPGTATPVALDDATPAGLSVLSASAPCQTAPQFPCALPDLAPGSSLVVGAIFDLPLAYGGASPIVNQATVTPADFALGAPNTDAESTPVATDLAVAIIAESGDPVKAGTTVTYTVRVENLTGFAATGVAIAGALTGPGAFVSTSGCDNDAAGHPTCTLGTVAGSSFEDFTVTFAVDASATALQSLEYVASLGPGVLDLEAGNDSDAETTAIVTSADLQVTKGDAPDPVTAGESLVYTVEVTNAGPSDAQTVLVTDLLPGGVTLVSTTCDGVPGMAATCDLGTVAAGATETFTLMVTVGSGVTGALSNTASVTSATAEESAGDESAMTTTTVVTVADLELRKLAPFAALSGETIVYTLEVENHGPSDATDVVITDTLPAAAILVATTGCAGQPPPSAVCAVGDVAAGATAVVTMEVVIDPTFTGALENAASVAGSGTDDDPSNDAATAATEVTATADLELAKAASPSAVGAGDVVTYTLTVTNHGPSASTGGEVVDVLPAPLAFLASADGCAEAPAGTVTCPFGPLGVGASVALDFTVTVGTPVQASIENDAAVSGDQPDDVPGNDAASATVGGDATPPRVTSVVVTPPVGGVALEPCAALFRAPAVVRVTFDEEVADPPGDTGDDVTNPNNYRVFAAGADRDLESDLCAAAVGDDSAAAIAEVTWDGATRTAAVRLASPLADDLYRLVVCGSTSIVDGAGNPLDGDGDGTGGDDFVLPFRVDAGNRFAGGHFDCDLAAWDLGAAHPLAVTHDPAVDVEGSSESGAARIESVAGTSFALDQCHELAAGAILELTVALRVGSLDGAVAVGRGCRFFAGPGCAGSELAAPLAVAIVTAPATSFGPLAFRLTSPPGTGSARCGFDLEVPDGAELGAWLDAARLVELPFFADGFESGDTAAWSAASP